MAAEASLQVSVLCAPKARVVHETQLRLAAGSTVLDALQASGFLQQFEISNPTSVGVWGRKAALSQVLRDQDRVEIYRTLKVDPKVARRERFAKQGVRMAGLFNKQRPNGKAGY
jgi:putative ubiquitin-RnfH superfamily antitoxin RatB of RatAB toxin-antitoxin module